MASSDYIVFVDESGDHSLESIDEDYPVFVLSFCIFKKTHYIEDVIPAIKRLKFGTFGHDLAILHERDIRRKSGWFSKLGKEPREEFMDALSALIEAIPFTLIAVVIDKKKLKRRYTSPAHPYHLALQFGLERLARFLRGEGEEKKSLAVICEARGGKEDGELELAFRRVCDGDNFSGDRYPYEIHIADKKCNSEGLQLADLTARPIGMSVLKPGQANRAFDVLRGKLYRNGYGMAAGFGLKTFP